MQQSPEQIIRRALAIYTENLYDCFAIKELASQPDDRLTLLNRYRKDPVAFRKYYEEMKEEYTINCPECGKEFIALPEEEYRRINLVRNRYLTGGVHCLECGYYFDEE